MTIRTVLMLLLVVSLASCATDTRVQDGATAEQAVPITLDGTSWVSGDVSGIDLTGNTELPQDTAITLQFTGNRLDGHIDCNDFGGPYEIDDGELSLAGPPETTEMYCEIATAWDECFQDLLSRSPNAQLLSGRLVIANQGDRVVFSPAGQRPTDATETSWTPVENYAFTVALSGGIEPIQGTLQIAVVADEVADVEPMDRPARLSDLDVGRGAPTYQDILDHLDYSRSAGYEAIDVTLDPETVRPTSIWLDDLRSIDDERAYLITDYTSVEPVSIQAADLQDDVHRALRACCPA